MGHVESVLFLMPCHSTPYYSHFNRNIPMRFIPCEPPLKELGHGETNYQDETNVFFESPKEFIQLYFNNQTMSRFKPYQWTSHIVMFDSLAPQISSELDQQGYSQTASFFNSHFNDAHRQGRVVVYSKPVHIRKQEFEIKNEL